MSSNPPDSVPSGPTRCATPRSGLFQGDQTRTYGEFHQLRAGVQLEPVHDPLPMAGNGLVAEAKLLTDLEVAQSLRDHLQHLPLACTQNVKARGLDLLRSLGERTCHGGLPAG